MRTPSMTDGDGSGTEGRAAAQVRDHLLLLRGGRREGRELRRGELLSGRLKLPVDVFLGHVAMGP